MDKSYDLQHDLLMRSIKILDIGYIAAIYFVFALICGILIDKYIGDYDPEKDKEKSLFKLWVDNIIFLWFIGVLIYIARNLVELIPFPLDGYQGFQHKRVKELGNASIFVFILMSYQVNTKGRLNNLYKRTREYFNIKEINKNK